MSRVSQIPALICMPYPQASFVLDFASNYYRGSGAQGSSPSALPGYNFTRALAAYAEDTAGNLIQFASGVPRITNKGVLIEEARTNVLLQSTTLANFSTTNATNTTDGTLSLTGNLARKVTSLTAAATSFNYNIAGGAAAGANTVSVYAKKGSGSTDANTFALRNATTATTLVSIAVNYDTGAFSYSTGSSGAVVTPMANGWWRISLTSSSFSAGDGLQLYAAFQGNIEAAGEYAYLADAQGEGGSFATSYIPTTSASVTRPADVFYYSTTLYQASQTVAAQADKSPSAPAQRIIGGEIGARTALYQSDSTNAIGTYNGTTVLNKIAPLASTNYSVASWDAAGRKVTLNGATPASDANTMSDWGKTYIGSGNGSNQFHDAYIQRLAIYPFAASDAQLQSISSGNF